MISIDRVYKSVLRLANSDIRGNVTPEDIRVFINDSVNEIYEDYFPDESRMVNRQNRGLTGVALWNIPERIRERALHFLVEEEDLVFEDGYFLIPDTVRYIDNAHYLEKEIEFYKNSREFRMVASNVDTTPSTTYPIGLKVGEKIKVAPNTITEGVKLSYLRKPIIANWAYEMVNGSEQVNPDAADYRDIDLHPGEENKLILLVLKRCGINLREQDLVGITTNDTNTEFNQDNSL